MGLTPRQSPGYSRAWWNDYVGIPFQWNGYGPDAVSCWGLVHLVYAEVFGIALPRYDDAVGMVEAGRLRRADRWTHTPGFSLVREPYRSGDILHLWGVSGSHRTQTHCGVVTEPGRVLHAEEATGSVISRYKGDNRFADRVIGAYRCKIRR